MSGSTGEERSGLKALLADPLLPTLAGGARPGLLVLDYDGTLAPFRAERDRAVPWPGVARTLAGLPVDGPGRYLLLSGRDAGQVLGLLGVSPAPEVWGSHGGQRRRTDGSVLAGPPPPDVIRGAAIHDRRDSFRQAPPCRAAPGPPMLRPPPRLRARSCPCRPP